MTAKFWTFLITTLLLVTGCSKSEVVTTYEQEVAKQIETNNDPIPVAFGTYVGEQATTRTGGGTALANLATYGFSVFAFYQNGKYFPETTTEPAGAGGSWETYKADWATDNVYPNFMYNQKVTSPDGGVTWNYSPVKYWPNGETTYDDAPANRLSFVAYGEHMELATETVSKGASGTSFIPYSYDEEPGKFAYKTKASSGIVAISRNDYEGEPFLIYDLKGDEEGLVDAKDMRDLLLATVSESNHFNLTKQNISSKISFNFQHALSAFGFGVTGVFNDANQPVPPAIHNENTIDENCYLRIEEIKMEVSLPRKAVMYLVHQNWIAEETEDIVFRMGADQIAENLRYPDYFKYKTVNVGGVLKTVVDEEATTAEVQRLNDAGELLSYGVGRIYNPGEANNGNAIPNNDTTNYYQIIGTTPEGGENMFYFIPLEASSDVSFTFTITYHTLSADPRMLYGLCDVKHVVKKEFVFTGMPGRTEAKNKKFIFNLLLGMTEVNIKGVYFADKYYFHDDNKEDTPYSAPAAYYSFPKYNE